MNLGLVTDLLCARIGLDPESLGPTVLPRAIQSRMHALGLTSPADYAARLAGDPLEFQILLGDLTVPETWFFRGGEVFAYLARHIDKIIRQQPASRYRVLSVPCSTGEEPYSLVIALVEAGVPNGGWVVEGIDLSAQLIERARQGRFTDFSFRQTTAEVRQRYFRPVDGGWELDPEIRSLVRFHQGNLLDPLFLIREEPFDLIFCRNLFVYLHPEARRRAMVTLDRLLARQGLLCAGHAEPIESLDSRFERTGPEGLFLYRPAARSVDRGSKIEDGRSRREDRKSPVEDREGHGSILDAQSSILDPQSSVLDPRPSILDPPPNSPAAADLLARAKEQADTGHLDEALATCEASLNGSGPSADLFSLMGVLHQARRKKDEAARCFQRALYLEPGHQNALTHLMLLCQEQGDHVQAARLRRRLERIAPGGEA